MCKHVPMCPPANSPGHAAAHVVAFHPEQGWSLLCNGVVLFDDNGELLPDGRALDPVAFAGPSVSQGLRTCRDRSAPQPAMSEKR